MAVKAPWPSTGEEDKILTRQAKFLRESTRIFRTQSGKAKKAWSKASIVVSDAYPQWKVNLLLWMKEQYDPERGFPSTFMKDLKLWAGKSAGGKKQVSLSMKFASFAKKEVEDVGEIAMDVQLPFDQSVILGEALEYIKKQTNIAELNIIKIGSGEASEVPERVADGITPGKPSLWFR